MDPGDGCRRKLPRGSEQDGGLPPTNDATPHGARQVKGPNDRQSFAVYYYTKTPPPWYQGNHSTLFFERPDGSLLSESRTSEGRCRRFGSRTR